MPPHMPIQWAPPIKPNTNAANSGGRSSPVGFMARFCVVGCVCIWWRSRFLRGLLTLTALFGGEVVFIVIEQNAVRGAFQVVELVIFHRPEKCPDSEAE